MIGLEDLETLAEDALGAWPQEIVGKRLRGWVVTPGGTVHTSQLEAKMYVEDGADNPIHWHDPFPDKHPSPAVFGAHPRIIAHWKTTGHLQPGCNRAYHSDETKKEHDRAHDDIYKEIGDLAYAQWVISMEHEPILGPIKAAVLPHPFSRFFVLDTSYGAWEVWEYSPFSKNVHFVERAASRAEAVIAAGLADYQRQTKQSGSPELQRRDRWRVMKKRALTIAIVAGVLVGIAAVLP